MILNILLLISLFSKVDNEIFRRPTYAALLALFDNYAENAEIAERVTDEELREENVFLDLILNTNVMQKAHQFLVEHGNIDLFFKCTFKLNAF